MEASENQQPVADEAQQVSDPTDLHASSEAPSEDTGGSSPEQEGAPEGAPEEYPEDEAPSVADMDLPEEVKANLIGEAAPEDEEPPVRYEDPAVAGLDASTAPRTAPVPPPFPVGEQPGFKRPEGSLAPAIRPAERMIDRDPSTKGERRRAERAAQGQ